MDRRLLLVELAAIVALTLADLAGYVPLSRTPFLLLLCWRSLRMRRMSWREIGLSLPPRKARAIILGVLAGFALEALALTVTTPLISSITGAPPDHSDWQPVVGNLPLLLILLAASWILAAFGEEIAFRGYLMNRTADVAGRNVIGWTVTLILVSVFFGIGHGTQGITGILQESLSGFWLGALFLATRRNLTVPIVAHGVSNTVAFVLIFFGRYPGLG